jgi:hypothetical protein
MLKILSISILIIVSLPARVFADDGEKVIKEFVETEVHYKYNNPSVKDPELVLRENIMNAIKVSVTRHYPEKKLEMQNLDQTAVQYEQIVDTRIVIAKYADLVFEFRFTANPRRYQLSPVSYKYYKTPNKNPKQTELKSSGA